MAVILLDPRFPQMIPVEAIPLLSEDVSYTEEVPVRVRWVIADLGGHTVDEAEVLITTDPDNELVIYRLEQGEDFIKSPSLMVLLEPDREIPSGQALTVQEGGVQQPEAVVEGHMVATARTSVPHGVLEEIEDAIALMARALRQGEWEQSMTHELLLRYLKEESDELAAAIAARNGFRSVYGVEDEAAFPAYIDTDLAAELSDVFLQVLFHAELANRRGSFDIGHVATAFINKMRSRAPYLFEDEERDISRAEQDHLWESGKAAEKALLEEKVQAKDREGYNTYTALKEEALSLIQSRSSAGKTSDAPSKTSQAQEVQEAQEPQKPQKPKEAQSVIAEVERIIQQARKAGWKDTDIPADLRYPMIGLERDQPGAAEKRLKNALEEFRLLVETEEHKSDF